MIVVPSREAHWLHFAAVVSIQMVYLLVLARIRRSRWHEVRRALAVGAGTGVVLGFAFDLIVGSNQGVFSYHLPAEAAFIFANGLLSYGIACTTASLLPVPLPKATPGIRRWGGLTMALAAGVVIAILAAPWTLPAAARMVASGIVILSAGELGAVLLGRAGPLLQCSQGNPIGLYALWRWSVITGLVYESANLFFPVWSWNALASFPLLPREAVIVLFGYIVLCHPMTLVSRLLIDRTSPTIFPAPHEG